MATERLHSALTAMVTDDAAAFVQSQGSAFVPASLPKGLRHRKPGNCYAFAGGLALNGAGFYVDGFALYLGDAVPLRHAWITSDGTYALDPSCLHALECV